MRTSTKFPVAVHAMIMIAAATAGKRKINSESISESTGVNAVIIRKIFKSLKEVNMISVSPGPGGVTLARSADSITLWDIFAAMEPLEMEELFKFHQNPSEDCPIGRNIYGLLKTHFGDAISSAKRELSSVTVSMLLEQLQALESQLPPLSET